MIHHTVTLQFPTATCPVYIGEHIYADPVLLARHIHGQQVLIVTQETIAAWYLEPLLTALQSYHCDVFLLPPGEVAKNLTEWQRLLDRLVTGGHERSTTLIALGGGVVGDITGFAAACYQRGVNYLQIPTTLIAQVDAAIGGKTAVNHPLGKNLIGAFHQPQAVLADVTVLQTLSPREYRAGLAEVIKCGLIADADFFQWLMTHREALLLRETDVLVQAIHTAARIKAVIVESDEHDQGRRHLLNFGHTFGHALEAAGGFEQYLHGEAVAIGMALATLFSRDLGYLSAPVATAVLTGLRAFGFALDEPLPPAEALLALMQRDKKAKAGQVNVILLSALGQAETVTVTASQLRRLLESRLSG